MTEDKALSAVSPQETQQERFALLVVFGDGDSGKGLSIAAASRAVGIDQATGRRWWRSQAVQDKVREYLDINRRNIQLRANKLLDKAFRTLDKAMDSPAYTPTQRAAAKDIITLAAGSEMPQDTHIGLVVNVATGLPATVMAQQMRRQRRHEAEDVVEGDATPVE